MWQRFVHVPPQWTPAWNNLLFEEVPRGGLFCNRNCVCIFFIISFVFNWIQSKFNYFWLYGDSPKLYHYQVERLYQSLMGFFYSETSVEKKPLICSTAVVQKSHGFLTFTVHFVFCIKYSPKICPWRVRVERNIKRKIQASNGKFLYFSCMLNFGKSMWYIYCKFSINIVLLEKLKYFIFIIINQRVICLWFSYIL